jgi:hypothetical protein
MDELGLGTLDYIYAPSKDVAADLGWFTLALGAEVVFAIESEGSRVAMLRVGSERPPVLLTDHLPDERPVFVYRVASLAAAAQALATRGWTADRTLELPMGPAMTGHAPGGLRLAVYEAARPFVVDSMGGRRDF